MLNRESAGRISRRSLLGGALGVAALFALDRTGVAAASAVGSPATTAGAPLPMTKFATQARHNLTAAEYQAEFDRLTGQGYRPVRVSGYDVGGQARYAAIWEKSPGPEWVARHGLTAEQYQAEFDRQTKQGFRPALVNGYSVGNQVFYAAIFERAGGPEFVARHGLTDAEYAAEFKRLDGQGYRLRHVSGYAVDGKAFFAAIWDRSTGPEQFTQHAMSAAQYQSEFDRLNKQGFRLVHVSGYVLNNVDMYAAIWSRGAGPAWAARHGLAANDYQTAFNEWTGKGYRPADVSGYATGGTPKFAGLWENQTLADGDFAAVDAIVAKYMADKAIPGVSIAIARRGALVFARGYGVANRDTNERMTERHLLRVASISKPITSATIMQLVEAGKLKLTDTVFGQRGVLGTKYGQQPYGENIEAITVRHLLQHTAGGWTNDNTDPMFTNPTMNQEQLITWTLDNRKLVSVPGQKYAYSNFGYCVLGRVVEKVTGQPYTDYVRQNVLGRCGITNMQLAGDTLKDRRSDEAVYYGADDPYGMQVRRMDSHGGWLATPSDLVRFALRVDGFSSVADILRPDTITTMTTPSTANAHYASGWAVNELNNRWHDGKLPGTSGIMVRTNHEFAWAALANSRDIDLDQMMWDVHNAVAVWPSQDLF